MAKKTTKASKKSSPKASAKNGEAKTGGVREKLGKAQLRILKALSQHKELTYRGISDKAKVGYNGLTSILSASSKGGKVFPNSLESRGLIQRKEYEAKEGSETREAVHFNITPAGRKALETGVAAVPGGATPKAVAKTVEKKAEKKAIKKPAKTKAVEAPKTEEVAA